MSYQIPTSQDRSNRNRFNDEAAFRAWYSGWAKKANLDPDPDNPRHKYDYRAAFRAGAKPEIDASDNQYHWPSEFKADDHPNRYVKTKEGILDSKTGQIDRRKSFISALKALPQFEGWEEPDIERNIGDVIASQDSIRQSGLFKALGELDNYSGWELGEIRNNVFDVLGVSREVVPPKDYRTTAIAESTLPTAELAEQKDQAFAEISRRERSRRPSQTALQSAEFEPMEKVTPEESAEAGAVATVLQQGMGTVRGAEQALEPRVVQAGRTVAGTFTEMTESGLRALQWAGIDAVKPVADKVQEWSEALAVENPDLMDTVLGGYTSTLAFFIPGMGLAKSAQVLSRFAPAAARTLGAGAAGFLESGIEAGSVYKDMLAQGADEADASTAASETFIKNFLVISITNRFGLFGEQGNAIKRAVASSSLEGVQEGFQQYISNTASGRDPMEGVLESLGIGALVGGTIGSVTGRQDTGEQEESVTDFGPRRETVQPETGKIEAPPELKTAGELQEQEVKRPTSTPTQPPAQAQPAEPRSAKTIPASPQAALRLKQLREGFAKAKKEGTQFSVSKNIYTSENVELFKDSPSMTKELNAFADQVKAYNKPLQREAVRKKRAEQKAKLDIPALQKQVEEAGGVFKGVTDDGSLVSFDDPKTGSTLAYPVKDVSPEAITEHLRTSREKFGVKEEVQPKVEEKPPSVEEPKGATTEPPRIEGGAVSVTPLEESDTKTARINQLKEFAKTHEKENDFVIAVRQRVIPKELAELGLQNLADDTNLRKLFREAKGIEEVKPEVKKSEEQKSSPAIENAKRDIRRAIELQKEAPETSEPGSGVKTKADFQKYIDETQAWIDTREKKKPVTGKSKYSTLDKSEYPILSKVGKGSIVPEWTIDKSGKPKMREEYREIDPYLLDKTKPTVDEIQKYGQKPNRGGIDQLAADMGFEDAETFRQGLLEELSRYGKRTKEQKESEPKLSRTEVKESANDLDELRGTADFLDVFNRSDRAVQQEYMRRHDAELIDIQTLKPGDKVTMGGETFTVNDTGDFVHPIRLENDITVTPKPGEKLPAEDVEKGKAGKFQKEDEGGRKEEGVGGSVWGVKPTVRNVKAGNVFVGRKGSEYSILRTVDREHDGLPAVEVEAVGSRDRTLWEPEDYKSLTVREAGVPPKRLTKEDFQKQLKDRFKNLSEEQLQTAMISVDAFVKYRSDAMEMTPEEVYAQMFAGVKGNEGIPDNALFQYIGENANLRDDIRENLHYARYLESQGSDPNKVRLATGWFRNPYDQKWRYEIQSDKMLLKVPMKELTSDEAVTKDYRLSDIVDYKDLFRSYPQMNNISIDISDAMGKEIAGSWNPLSATLHLNRQHIAEQTSTEELRKVLVHEIQHAIQYAEGFARGGNLRRFLPKEYEDILKTEKDLAEKIQRLERVEWINNGMTAEQGQEFAKTVTEFRDAVRKKLSYEKSALTEYMRVAGEIESRDVEARLKLSREERRNIRPLSSETVSPDQAIVLFGQEFEDMEEAQNRFRLARMSEKQWQEEKSKVKSEGGLDAVTELIQTRDKQREEFLLDVLRSKRETTLDVLEEEMGIPRSAISGTARRLQQQGLVEIEEPDSKEGGPLFVPFRYKITAKGDELGAQESRTPINQTPAFKKWFGESKVVDEQGNPMVVYHATAAEDFDRFKRRRSDIGMHFGTEGQANDRLNYVFRHKKTLPEGARLYPVYLQIENPLRLGDIGWWNAENLEFGMSNIGVFSAEELQGAKAYNAATWLKNLRDLIERKGYDGIVYKNEGETGGGISFEEQREIAWKKFVKKYPEAKSGGISVELQKTPEYAAYDKAYKEGLRYRQEHAEDSYIAFHPTQIKSATGNRGTFDPNDPNITHSVRGQKLTAQEEASLRESIRGLLEKKKNLEAQYDFAKSQPHDKAAGKERRETTTRNGLGRQVPVTEVVNLTYGQKARALFFEIAKLQKEIDDIQNQLDVRDIKAKPQEDMFGGVREKPGQQTLFQESGPANWYYSGLQKILESKMPNKASADQIRGIIRDAKKEEIQWTGLDEFLRTKSTFTKDEILSYLKENEVRVEEVVRGETINLESKYAIPEVKKAVGEAGGTEGDLLLTLENDGDAYRALTKKFPELKDADGEEGRPHWAQIVAQDVYGGETKEVKFSQYVLPGGKEGTYRELLLKLPEVERKTHELRTVKDAEDEFSLRDQHGNILRSGLHADQIDHALAELAQEESKKGFVSGHFDEPNVFAHIRFNERTDAEGKSILFIEEIQSDWAQRGRKEGYEGAKKRLPYEPEVPEGFHVDEGGQIREGAGGVPLLPFAKNWHEVAFRRAVRWAAENGFDSVGWTTGEQQADRYDLSTHINSIRVHKVLYPEEAAGWHLDVKTKNQGDIRKVVKTESELADNIGKELAERAVNEINQNIEADKKLTPKQRAKTEGDVYEVEYQGLDLKVGGTGMKGFYDKIIVDYANKFGKKFGSRVQSVGINLAPEGGTVEYSERRDGYVVRDARGMQVKFVPNTPEGIKEAQRIKEQLRTKSKTESVHSLPITREMRDSAMRGFPLFQSKKGAVQFLSDGRAIIHAFEQADFSTVMHELGHVFRRHLDPVDLKIAEEWTGVLEGKWTREHEEKFARGFERYLAEGKAPNTGMKSIFEKFKKWMLDVYREIAGSDIDVQLSPEIREVFDRIFGEESFKVSEDILFQEEQKEPIAPTKAQNEKYLHELMVELEKQKKNRKTGDRKRPIISLMKDTLAVYHLEGVGRGLKGQRLTEFVRGHLIRELKDGEQYKQYATSGKLHAANRLLTENVNRWIRLYEKSKRQMEAQKEIDDRNARIQAAIGLRMLSKETDPARARRILELAKKHRTTGDTQGHIFAGFMSRQSQMAKSYGQAGPELQIELYEGQVDRDRLVETAKVWLNKINDVYEKVEKPSEIADLNMQVVNALEDRGNAQSYLKTDQAKEVYKNATAVLDYFKKQIEAAGYPAIDDYFPRIVDHDVLSQIFDMIANSDSEQLKAMKERYPSLMEIITANSPHLKERTGAEFKSVNDVPYVLGRYVNSVSKALSLKNAMQYYYERFQKDIPKGLQHNSLERARKLVKNVVMPERGRGKAFKVANWIRSRQYPAFLGYNIVASVINRTQVDLARWRWSRKANKIERKLWRRAKKQNLSGALADAIDMASTRATRFLELEGHLLSDETKGALRKYFDRHDPFQRGEALNWGETELGSIINSVMKDRRYEGLAKELGDEGALNKLLEEQDVFDKAVREARVTAAETQVSAMEAMRAEAYDSPSARIILMFTAFKFRQFQLFAQQLGRQEGINGTRALRILERGVSGEAEPVEVLREIETNRRAVEKLIKEVKRTKDLGVSLEDARQLVRHLKTQEAELNQTIKEIENTGSGAARMLAVAKYNTKLAGMYMAFGLLYGMIDAELFGDDDEETMAQLFYRTALQLSPLPFYGTNPAEFMTSPVIPEIEAFIYGKFSGRSLVKNLTRYAFSLNPYLNLADRVMSRGISKALVDEIAPPKNRKKDTDENTRGQRR